jgi:hypothetical protein
LHHIFNSFAEYPRFYTGIVHRWNFLARPLFVSLHGRYFYNIKSSGAYLHIVWRLILQSFLLLFHALWLAGLVSPCYLLVADARLRTREGLHRIMSRMMTELGIRILSLSKRFFKKKLGLRSMSVVLMHVGEMMQCLPTRLAARRVDWIG